MDEKMEFQFIDWQLYFGVFQGRLTNPHSTHKTGCSFITFMEAFEMEFLDKRLKQAMIKYQEASRHMQPFASYRLAQVYLKVNKFNEPVDFELSWFYLIKSTVLNCLHYTKDVFKGRDKLCHYIDKLDTSYTTCLQLIEKFEVKGYVSLMKCCFKLVMSHNTTDNIKYYEQLIRELQECFKRQRATHLIELSICLITAKMELKHKPIDMLTDILLMNSEVLSRFVEEQFGMLGMLVSCPQDNILLSKIRDVALQVMYLCKIFKFAMADKDVHFMKVNECIFLTFCRLFDNIDKVSLLQDRIFITYYLSEMLYKQGKKQQCQQVFKELEELIMIKPQPGTEGFYYYLKAKIENKQEYLEKSAVIYQKEHQSEDNHQMIVEFYLSRIEDKLRHKEASESHLVKSYQIYINNSRKWNELTLQTTCYFRRICRRLKRLKQYPLKQPPKQLFHLLYVDAATSSQQATQSIQSDVQLRVYDPTSIKVIRIFCKLISSCFYHAIIEDKKHALVQQLPIANEIDKNRIIAEISEKHNIVHKNLHRIIGYCQEAYESEGGTYYIIKIIYPPCVAFHYSLFEDQIREMTAVISAYNYASYKIDTSCLIKAYSLNRELVLVGWGAPKSIEEGDLPLTKIGIIDDVLGKYNLEFLSRKVVELDSERLEKYLEELFLRI